MQFWTIYALSGALFIDILCPYQEPSNRWRHKHKPSWTLRMNTNLIFLQPASRGYWWFLRAYSTLMYTQFSYIRLELNVWYFAVRVLIYWVTCFVIDKSLILWIYGPDFLWCYLVWLSKEQNCLATQGFLYFQVFSNFYQEFFLLFISFIQFFLSWSTNCPSLAHFLLLNMEMFSFLDTNKMGSSFPVYCICTC